jgi:hypothetical protein
MFGADNILNKFRFIKLEVSDFEAYSGCCLLRDIIDFMYNKGFKEYKRKVFKKTKTGCYYDIIFVKK